MRASATLGSGLFIAVVFANNAFAGVALFANATDTIQVSSGTTLTGASTYEARILFTTVYNRTGMVFNEWTNGAEDKTLYAGPGSPGTLTGYNYPVGGPPFNATPTIALNLWHHIALVYDGSEERFYVDGTEVVSRAVSGTITNGPGLPFIGSINRGGLQVAAFGGYLDWLRVSDIARYSGTSFSPPSNQPASDTNTQLLYYFDEALGSTTATDQSSFHRDGTLGVGFAGATSPVFTSDPLNPITTLNRSGMILLGLMLAGLGAAGLASRWL